MNYHNSPCGRYFILKLCILHRKDYPSLLKLGLDEISPFPGAGHIVCSQENYRKSREITHYNMHVQDPVDVHGYSPLPPPPSHCTVSNSPHIMTITVIVVVLTTWRICCHVDNTTIVNQCFVDWCQHVASDGSSTQSYRKLRRVIIYSGLQ